MTLFHFLSGVKLFLYVSHLHPLPSDLEKAVTQETAQGQRSGEAGYLLNAALVCPAQKFPWESAPRSLHASPRSRLGFS